MSTPRILLGTAWVASLAAAYLIGGSGDSSPNPASAIMPATVNSTTTAEKSAAARPSAEDLPEEARKGPPDVHGLIARARAELANTSGGMMNVRAMLRALAPLADLDIAQIQEALSDIEKSVREPQQKMMFYSILLGQWAEADGRAAMTYAQSKLDKNSMFNMGVTASVLGTWARRDPEAAWQFFQTAQGGDDSERTRMMGLNAVFAGLAANNLESALARVATLDEASRANALSGIAGSMSDDASRRALLARSSSLPDDEKLPLRQSIVQQWIFTNPDDAVAYIRSLPVDDQKSLRANAGMMLMNVKPALGAEMMLEGASDKDRPQLYSNAVAQWANMDARAAGTWLSQQPQGPELDLARSSYASAIAPRDPAAAFDWARSITTDQQRTESVTTVYQQWHLKDPAAADAALTASGLPVPQVEQIRNAPAPTPTGPAPSVRSYGR